MNLGYARVSTKDQIVFCSCQNRLTEKQLTNEIYLKGSNDDGYIIVLNYLGKEIYYKYSDVPTDTVPMIREGKQALEFYKKQTSI